VKQTDGNRSTSDDANELAVLLRAGRATGEDMPEITNWKWPGK
jgi:phosphoketolase